MKPPAHSERALRLVAPAPASASEGLSSEQLYERVAPVVSKLLWTFLGPDPERDDLAHEVFLRILKNANKLRDPARLEAWAARVTVNAIKNEFRSRKLRRWFTLTGTEPPDTRSYHPDFEGRELLVRTYRILALLPTQERLPLTLRLIHQSSQDEIACACGCSLRTIKRRLQSAQARFLRLAASDQLLAERLRRGELGGEGHE